MMLQKTFFSFFHFAAVLMISLFPLRVQAALSREIPAAPVKFLTDAYLTQSEDLWITAEAGGVYRLNGKKKTPEWEDMRKHPGFPQTDNCTSVCEDSQGRIWVGTANMGVLVFLNGKWQRYDRDTVLSGSHIHDLACAASGLTAVAHEQGVSVYDSRDNSWRDFTVLNGLPAGGVCGVSFGREDCLNCAMESGGYVRIDVRKNARSVRQVSAPESWGKQRATYYPLTTAGKGLCSNFCNGISIGSQGQVCIASVNGISYNSANGVFQFLQGKDLKKKMDGAARKELIENELKTFRELGSALKESYVNSVYYGKNGLWVGYRNKGFELRNASNPQKVLTVRNEAKITRPVCAFVEVPDGRVYCATYGAGLVEACRADTFAAEASHWENSSVNHPSYQRRDSVSILAELNNFDKNAEPMSQCWAQYIGEDWCTLGDWCGRYGARRNLLCAGNAPRGNSGKTNVPITISGSIGPHHDKNDSMRLWVEWIKADEKNRNVLYKMEYAYRTESEWDDHGEAYPRTFEGPDLWVMLDDLDPEEIWRLALYFYNPNGRIGENHERDYILEVYASNDRENLKKCLEKKPLCTARVSDFASGGVYKIFALHGSRRFFVRIIRNGSMNTILNGVFMEHLFEAQDVRKISEEQRIPEQGKYRAPRWYNCNTNQLKDEGVEYFKRYFAAPESVHGLSTMFLLRLLFYRYVCANLPSNKNLSERLRWDAAIWTEKDRKDFDAAMKEYWAELQEQYPERRSSEYCPNCPGVTPLALWEIELMDILNIDWKPYRIGATEKPELSLENLRKKLNKEKVNYPNLHYEVVE